MPVQEKFRDHKYIVVIKKYMREHGFCCDSYKPSYLQRRMQVRLRSNQLDSFRDYSRLLRTERQEYRKLVDSLTINVTKFFRDPDVYEFLKTDVIPGFFDGHSPSRTIRIWSAGCATGEEPYSLAIIMLESLKGSREDHRFSIFATDIDESSLETARQGIYTPEKLGSLRRDQIQKYFAAHNDYQVKQDLKSHVKFRKSDLLADRGIDFCDLILCRNVLIYFDRAHQGQTIKKLHHCLRDNCHLVLGKTEILPPGFADLFACIDRRSHIYRKMSIQEDV